MVVPAVMPLATQPGQDYWAAKKEQAYLSFAANIIGAAVGTPVGLTFMQDLGGAPEGSGFTAGVFGAEVCLGRVPDVDGVGDE